MIATIKVLGLKARDFATVAAAARRVVEYVQGGPVSTPSNAAAYYAVERSDGAVRIAVGTSRGSAAPLVGLRGPVNGEQLHRLLLGQHARTGMWLLAGRGSAGRTQAQHGPFGPGLAHALSQAPEVMTLAQAARIAGVSVRYLRRLAENHELAVSADSSTETEASGTVASGRVESVALSAEAGGSGPLSAEDALFSQPQRRPRAVGSDRDVLRAFRESGRRRWLVSREELARFMAERQPPTVVIGYDLTCSAPKSVSLLWAFGDPGLRADIQASLDAGIDAAFGYLERYAAVGTVGGRNQPAAGLAAACYRHEISRSEEAHLHVHNIVVNAVPVPVLDDHGRPVTDEAGSGRVEWRAIDGEVLLRHVKTAGYIGAATLRHELARRRGLEWGPVRNGVAELADFPKAVLEAFSTRHGELTEEFMQLVDAGFTADAATLAAAQRGSRSAKRVLSDPQVEEIQRRRLREAGFTVEQIQQLGAGRDRKLTPLTEPEVTAMFDRMVGPDGLTEQQPLFTQREVHQYIAAAARDRLDIAAITDLAERFLADPRIVPMQIPGRRRRNQDEDAYSTVELLEIEDALMALYR